MPGVWLGGRLNQVIRSWVKLSEIGFGIQSSHIQCDLGQGAA